MPTRSEVRAKQKRSKELGQSMSELLKFREAQKAFVKKKTAEGSAFGIKDTEKVATKKREAARKQAKQAGGSGRIGGSVKKLSPRKITRKKR